MSVNWAVVQKEHVKEACRRYDARDNCPRRSAKNTFLLFEGKRYPAKFIRGLAYEIATGRKLDSSDYQGGPETVQFFKKLGLPTEYSRRPTEGICTGNHIQQTVLESKRNLSKKGGLDPKKQKVALKKILEREFGHVETEVKFDWLVVPDRSTMGDVLARIYDTLSLFRGYNNFSTPGRQLKCDFFVPLKNLIVEYDERQHFTEPRAISLGLYPKNIFFPFDLEYWKEKCNLIKAKDPDKKNPFRDEQRAFYDSIRDILAARNRIALVRIKHGDCDWGLKPGREIINNLINPQKNKACTSNVDEGIEQISHYFTKLQEEYREWAGKFKSHEEVIGWLQRNNVNSRCKRQDSFNLLSSNWNSITIPTLYIIASDCMVQMKDRFDRLFQNLPEAQINRIWYLLYFIHPVRHELYHFDEHYPQGYSFRLARLIRTHRQGLKGVKTYLGKEDRTTDDPYPRACSTTAFKHIHLHPTTSTREKLNLQNIKEVVLRLEIGKGCLSSNELNVAEALSTKATINFEKWIEYAPCAINEGPTFVLRDGKSHSGCFREIVKILQSGNSNQNIMRDKLEEYYKIDG